MNGFGDMFTGGQCGANGMQQQLSGQVSANP